MKNKKTNFNRGARTYLESAVKAASHPVRNQILRNLKQGPLTTVSLQDRVGESRYNLYHHLEVLIKADLILEMKSEGKTKRYKIKIPKRPEAGVLLFSQSDLIEHANEWERVLDGLEKIEGEKIPFKKKIREIEVHLKY